MASAYASSAGTETKVSSSALTMWRSGWFAANCKKKKTLSSAVREPLMGGADPSAALPSDTGNAITSCAPRSGTPPRGAFKDALRGRPTRKSTRTCAMCARCAL